MAIDKRTFKGGMNKDIDQRLIPDDQYRDATNIKNLHGDDGTLGVITPVPGHIQKGNINANEGAPLFSFSSDDPAGGELTINVSQWQPQWGYYFDSEGDEQYKEIQFQLDYNLSDGTTTYEPTPNTHIVTETEYNNIIAEFTENVSNAQLHKIVATRLITQAIQADIAADATLASHIEVTQNDNNIVIQCLQPGFNLASPVWLDNHTSPAQDPLQFSDAVSLHQGKRNLRYTPVLASPPVYKCVGAVNDEVERTIYWLVTQISGGSVLYDYVLQYKESLDTINVVYKEKQSSTTAALNFPKNRKIHSLNVIGSEYLAWTDGVETPKRLNIAKSMRGLQWREIYGKRFYDNHSATYSSEEFQNVLFEGNENGLQDKLTLVSDSNFGYEPGDIIYVEQDFPFVYHEYNGYFKVTHVSSDGKKIVLNHEFINSSATVGGTTYRVIKYIEANENQNTAARYSYDFDPITRYWPEAYNNNNRQIKEQYINAHKRGPRDRATYEYLSDSTKKKNDGGGSVWQFSYRYLYDDEEASALAPISDVVIPAHMSLNAATGSSYDQTHHNRIKITIPKLNDGGNRLQTENQSGENGLPGSDTTPRLHGTNTQGNVGIAHRLYAFPSNIKAIEVYARKSNKDPFLLIDTVTWYTSLCVNEYAEQPNIRSVTSQIVLDGISMSGTTEATDPLVLNPVNTNFIPFNDLVVYFYNDGIYPVLDSRNADKLYDWLPHKAQTQEVIDNSSIIYANVTDGFDSACHFDASVEAQYKSSDDNDNPTGTTNFSVNVGPQFQVYVNAGNNYEANDTSFGSPNAISNDQQVPIGANLSGSPNSPGTKYSYDDPCPGIKNGHALVSWPGIDGTNGWGSSSWENDFKKNRLILQLDLSNIPTNGSGYVDVGTTFISSGSFKFAYKYGAGQNPNKKFGIGHQWEGVTATVTNETTTKQQFGDAIADAFASLGTHLVSSGTHWGVGNWRTTEVFADGTFYAPAAGQGKPGNMLYIHFRQTSVAGHETGFLARPKMARWSFEQNSRIMDAASTTATFKTGAFHDFGIVYGNNRNQTSFVNRSSKTRTYVKFPTERGSASTDGVNSDQTDALGLPSLKWSINHTPPDWAEWYQWVYAGNTTVKDFLQFTSERVAKNINDSGDRKIYINLNSFKGEKYSYKSIDNPLIDYVFGEGDRIRFLRNSEGAVEEYIDVPVQDAKVYQYQTEESDIDPALSNPLRQFYEAKFSNTADRKKYMAGYWISFNSPDVAGWRWEDISTSNDGNYHKLLFEIYNPKKQTEEGPIFFYGFSNKIPIETDLDTGDKYHASDGTGLDQNHDTNTELRTPATGYFTKGDVYLVGRRTVDSRVSRIVVNYASNNFESYFANDFIQSDSYNKGRKHTYNQYAKEEHRNTTVYYSGPYLPSSNVNGLSEFNLIDLPFKEYSIGYGDIERAIESDSNLILFHSNKVTRVMVQKALLMGATGDSNVALSDQILSVATPYAGNYGPAKAAESVVKYGRRIYFVDPLRGCMVRLSTDGLTLISQNGMKSYFLNYFRDRVAFLGDRGFDSSYTHVGGVDPQTNEYIYYGEAISTKRPVFDSALNRTVGFYEDLNKYVSFYTYKPEFMMNLGTNFYSFQNGYLYLHNQDETKANFNKFYGATTSDASKIELVFNGEPSMIKTYNNLSLEGTYPWTPGNFKTENFLAAFQTDAGKLHAPGGEHYWQRKEGVYYMPVALGSKQEFKDYVEKVSLEYEGISTVTYTSDTILTCSGMTESEVAQLITTGANYALFDGSTPSVPKVVTVESISGNELTVTIEADGTFVVDSTYFLVKILSPCVGIEGERPKGVFATCDFSIVPSDYTYLDTDQDLIELYAVNVDMSYSPLSYKNN